MTFSVDPLTVDAADALPGPDWLRQRRIAAMERFLAGPLPTDADEIWRYSRINEFDLTTFAPAVPVAPPDRVEPPQRAAELLSAIGARSGLVETLDGHINRVEGVTLGDGEGLIGKLTDAIDPWDAFVELNTALAPDPVVVRVPAGQAWADPIVIVHQVTSDGAAFPRTFVEVGVNARATVVELVVSRDEDAPRGYVAPVVELDIADGGHLEHLVVQQLGHRVWETAYHTSRVGRDGSLRAFTAALGGDYARVRTDSLVEGVGGATDLLALYFGDGAQMHDFRTLQDHVGAKSTSELVFKGAVTDEATSAYSGLIRVRKGAAGTRAFQTNRNLVLSDTGLASYSVPNLDIQENEVMCSHASATGPIDPDQRFYLESRGVPTEVADRLIVLGFFDDLLARLPVPGLRPALRAAVAAKLRRGAA